MATLDYAAAPGGKILMPVQGPADERPKKCKVPIRNGVVNPDGAIILHSATIGSTREFAEAFYRSRGYEPEFVEIP